VTSKTDRIPVATVAEALDILTHVLAEEGFVVRSVAAAILNATEAFDTDPHTMNVVEVKVDSEMVFSTPVKDWRPKAVVVGSAFVRTRKTRFPVDGSFSPQKIVAKVKATFEDIHAARAANNDRRARQRTEEKAAHDSLRGMRNKVRKPLRVVNSRIARGGAVQHDVQIDGITADMLDRILGVLAGKKGS
jgi:hypothetical protein